MLLHMDAQHRDATDGGGASRPVIAWPAAARCDQRVGEDPGPSAPVAPKAGAGLLPGRGTVVLALDGSVGGLLAVEVAAVIGGSSAGRMLGEDAGLASGV